MLALEVEYLMGHVTSSQREDRKAVEWPPHPARFFSALVAAYEECEIGEGARAALEWLEGLPPPAIYANPPAHDGFVRDVNDIFVPVNDVTNKLGVLPEMRSRQPRWFPSFTPHDPHVWFIWQDVDVKPQYFNALKTVAENVTYLGHSMSPVRVVVGKKPPKPTLIPDKKGLFMLRTTGPGRLEYLETLHELRKKNETLQPRLGKVTRYGIWGEPAVKIPGSFFHHAFIFKRKAGPNLPLEGTVKLTNIVRKSVMNLVPDPIPEILSGHDEEGKPSCKSHLAIAPLAYVDHLHADGHIMGFVLWLPNSATEYEYALLGESLERLNKITLGKYGIWIVEQLDATRSVQVPSSLRMNTYNHVCETWASVTPVVFGHHPKKREGKDALAVIGRSCENIGLPRPIEVRFGLASAFKGVPLATDFSRPKQAKGKLLAHVYIRFETKVNGPVIIGAGRYMGLGLCRPFHERCDV